MVASWSLAKLNPDSEQDLSTAIQLLTQGLGSDDALIRSAAVNGLLELEAPAELVAPALLKIANDPDPDVRVNVLEALASQGEKAVPRAIAALQKPELRELAVRVLTRLGPKCADAVQPLIELLPDAEPDLRADIHLALAAIGPAAAPATETLVAGLASDEPRIRHTAMRALNNIGPGAAAAQEALLGLLDDQKSVDAAVAAWALTAIAAEDAQVVARVLPVLQQRLQSPDAEVRGRSIDALAALGPAAREALPQLMKTAQHDDRAAVRAAALAAVKQISGST
jgi:HEAT repeat protein